MATFVEKILEGSFTKADWNELKKQSDMKSKGKLKAFFTKFTGANVGSAIDSYNKAFAKFRANADAATRRDLRNAAETLSAALIKYIKEKEFPSPDAKFFRDELQKLVRALNQELGKEIEGIPDEDEDSDSGSPSSSSSSSPSSSSSSQPARRAAPPQKGKERKPSPSSSSASSSSSSAAPAMEERLMAARHAAELCRNDVNNRLGNAQRLMRQADQLAAESDDILRRVVEEVAARNQGEAERMAGVLDETVKNMLELQKRIDAERKKAQAAIDDFRVKHESPEVKRSDAYKIFDMATGLRDAIVMMLEELNGNIAEARNAIAEAKAALLGNVDSQRVYLSSGAKLAERTIKRVATLDASFREITGAVDQIKFDVLNSAAKEAIETNVARQSERLATLMTDLGRSRTEIAESLRRFPAEILEHTEFKEHKDQIERGIGFFGEMLDGSNEAMDILSKYEPK